MSNSPRKRPELDKTVSVDDAHVNTPGYRQSRNSLWETKTVSNSPGNEPELAKITSVDDRHISAPWGSITMETALGPQNGE